MWKLRVYVYREKSGYQRRYVKLPSEVPEVSEVWVLMDKEVENLRGTNVEHRGTNGEASNGVPKETIGVPKKPTQKKGRNIGGTIAESLNITFGGAKYYVLCPNCGTIAHLTVEYGNREAWYYCPKCNHVFRKG